MGDFSTSQSCNQLRFKSFFLAFILFLCSLSSLAKELKEEENSLRQCIEKLKSVQGSRSSPVCQLKDALREQVILFFELWQVQYFVVLSKYLTFFWLLVSGIRTGKAYNSDSRMCLMFDHPMDLFTVVCEADLMC